MQNAAVKPPQVALVNLDTMEIWKAPFNPTTLRETLAANYGRATPPGLSHSRMQFANTENRKYPLEFFLSQIAQDIDHGIGIRGILADKLWLESLLYPSADIDFSYSGPPRVLFIWPSVLRIVGRVTNLDVEHRTFSPRSLATTLLIASVTIETDEEVRILSQDVLNRGEQYRRGTLVDPYRI